MKNIDFVPFFFLLEDMVLSWIMTYADLEYVELE
jgi:hypothetical protein